MIKKSILLFGITLSLFANTCPDLSKGSSDKEEKEIKSSLQNISNSIFTVYTDAVKKYNNSEIITGHINGEELKKFAETKIYGELIGHIYQSTTSGNTISNQGIFVNNGNLTVIQNNQNSIKDNKIIVNGKEIKSEYQKTLEKIDKNNPNWCN